MSDTSGPMFCEPFAYYDPDLSSLRMSQGTFPLGSTPSSVTLPKSGSMRAGLLYEHQMSAHPTAEPDSSLLPTPRARDHKSGRQENYGMDLFNALLPTPVARDCNGISGFKGAELDRLPNVVAALLPTPTARLGMPRGAQAARYTNPERSVDLDDAIAWMTGQTGSDSGPPSEDGDASSDDQRLPLW